MLKPHISLTGKWINSLTILSLLSVLFIGCSSSNSVREETLSRSDVNSLMVQRKNNEYPIQPGDEIEIAVWEYDEFNTTKTVTTNGIITVPLIGEIQAEGLTKEEFKSDLMEKLSNYIKEEIHLSVSIISPERNLVSVLGSVGSPDNYPVINSASLFEVLSKAGGTTDQADLRSIKIYQGGQTAKPLEVDLTSYLKRGNTQTLALVRPGDIVYVPQEENVLRELSSFIRDVVLLFGLFRAFN